MDQTLGYLIKRLKETNLFNNMNIVIVSDHGKINLILFYTFYFCRN
jgi:hypothetical protein